MIGEAVGGFRIVREIGRGGMGVVYLAEHKHLPRRACVKVLAPALCDRADVLGRFFQEARAAASVEHPGIVQVFDCDRHANGQAYILMELLEGDSLRAVIRRLGTVPLRELVALGRQMALALAAAHARGIIHRDVKPENVFVLSAPAGAIKVLDFGVAKLLEQGAGPGITRVGTVLGTPTYMSPEQCQGAREIDHRTDVYALGCILFEMAAGRPPFEETATGALLAAHVTKPAPRLTQVAREIPEALAALVDRMLAKAPGDRPAGMEGVATALDEIGQGEPARLTTAMPWKHPGMDAGSATGESGRETVMMTADGGRSSTSEHEIPAMPWWRRPAVLGTAGAGALLMMIALLAWPRGSQERSGQADGLRLKVVDRNAPPPPPADDPQEANPVVAIGRAANDPTQASPGGTDEAQAGSHTTRGAPAGKSLRAAEAQGPARSEAKAADSAVTLVISASPRDAVVCDAESRRRLGSAGSSIALRAGRTARLVVYRDGYHERLLSLVPRPGLRQTVKLAPLGPDELADLPCR